MSSKTRTRPLSSFSLRLTLWYAVLFIVSLVIIFLISYKVLISDLIHVVDRSLFAITATVENEVYKEGLDKVRTSIRESIEEEGKNRIFYRLLSPDLNVLATSDPLRWPCLNFPQMSRWARMAAGNHTVYRTLAPPDRNFKIRTISRSIAGGKYIVQIGKTMRDEEELVSVYRKVFLRAVAVLLLCGIFLAWVEAQKAFKRIEALMRQLKDVTDNIAHDLRTPITRIRGLAETMAPGKDLESPGLIAEECDRMVEMINTMLEIAQADAGLKQITKTPVDMVALVRKGCDLFLPLAQDKGIAIVFQGLSMPLTVMGEPARLQRVVSNLLDNALKFTPSGGSIRVQIAKNGARAVISVKDTGIGISRHEQNRIFEKFYRVESSRSTSGHGLGLSYVQSMVLAMGGTVGVQSALGQGSTFMVSLPLQ